MSAAQFAQPILQGSLRLPSFFNGRLLSAESLSQEQDTLQLALRRLGRAAGAGVAFGLEVSELRREGVAGGPPRPILKVTAGLAVNLEGQTLWLDQDVELPFLRPLAATPAVGGEFCECDQPDAAIPAVSGSDGAYVLTIAPVEQFDGVAPVSGLGNRTALCNHRDRVLAAQFQLKLLFPASDFAGAGAQLRNRVAYACFGAPNFTNLGYNPAAAPARQPGALDTARPGLLTRREVPLAVLYWTADDSLQFIDMWAVRRRANALGEQPGWLAWAGPGRYAESEAGFFQFQDQIDQMASTGAAAANTSAGDYFERLPAAGVLPVRGPGAPLGFDLNQFFGAHASRDVAMLDASRLRDLLDVSHHHEPVRLPDVGRLQLYFLWERFRAVETGASDQLLLVFTSPSVPYRGTARFGYGKSGLSRFAETVL